MKATHRQALVVGCLLLSGCMGESDRVHRERKLVRPVIRQFERHVDKGRADLCTISGDWNKKLASAQRVHDGGKALRNVLGDILVSGEGTIASARMVTIRDGVFDAYITAKSNIRAMYLRYEITRETCDEAILEIEDVWSNYLDTPL